MPLYYIFVIDPKPKLITFMLFNNINNKKVILYKKSKSKLKY